MGLLWKITGNYVSAPHMELQYLPIPGGMWNWRSGWSAGGLREIKHVFPFRRIFAVSVLMPWKVGYLWNIGNLTPSGCHTSRYDYNHKYYQILKYHKWIKRICWSTLSMTAWPHSCIDDGMGFSNYTCVFESLIKFAFQLRFQLHSWRALMPIMLVNLVCTMGSVAAHWRARLVWHL